MRMHSDHVELFYFLNLTGNYKMQLTLSPCASRIFSQTLPLTPHFPGSSRRKGVLPKRLDLKRSANGPRSQRVRAGKLGQNAVRWSAFVPLRPGTGRAPALGQRAHKEALDLDLRACSKAGAETGLDKRTGLFPFRFVIVNRAPVVPCSFCLVRPVGFVTLWQSW